MATLKYRDPETGQFKSDIHVVGAVSSVNGKNGVVELNSEDVGAMEYYILTFDGTHFFHDGVQLTFTQIKNACLDDHHFVYAQYDGDLYIPQHIQGALIFFDATYIRNGKAEIHRISITPAGTGTEVIYVADSEDLEGKQDVISDLDEIRDGAALGATSLQGSIDPTQGEEIPRGNGLDVRINGESIVEGGVANVPIAGNGEYGLMRTSTGGNGITITNTGYLSIEQSSNAVVDQKSATQKALTLDKVDRAIRAGLISNTQITDVDKPLICQTIGAVQNPKWELLYSFDGDDSTKELIYSVELVHMYYTISVDGGIEVPTISVYGYNSDTGTSLTDNMLMYHYNGGRSGATSSAKATGRLLKLGNMYRFESSTYTTRTNTSTLNRMNYDGVDEIISENNLHKLRFTVSSSTVFCRGIHIEVYGVRA